MCEPATPQGPRLTFFADSPAVAQFVVHNLVHPLTGEKLQLVIRCDEHKTIRILQTLGGEKVYGYVELKHALMVENVGYTPLEVRSVDHCPIPSKADS